MPAQCEIVRTAGLAHYRFERCEGRLAAQSAAMRYGVRVFGRGVERIMASAGAGDVG
ncbi:MAG: hypothetical protein M0Z68_11935 [Gammaproteobacteria bacterium]|nr:hypothetical protein [Gammaproteobacteria bacterium]